MVSITRPTLFLYSLTPHQNPTHPSTSSLFANNSPLSLSGFVPATKMSTLGQPLSRLSLVLYCADKVAEQLHHELGNYGHVAALHLGRPLMFGE